MIISNKGCWIFWIFEKGGSPPPQIQWALIRMNNITCMSNPFELNETQVKYVQVDQPGLGPAALALS